jgi:transposase
MSKGHRRGKVVKPRRQVSHLEQINHHAAGIDVGAETHYVAVPPESAAESVREFGVFTGDLHALADWLKQCQVTTVALESTGVYWIPLYELLEQRGFEVKLVDARKVKNVSGRKSDVLDCQWLQQLHTYGLLSGAFRPADEIVVLRAFLRQREMLVRLAAKHIQHIQKALQQMNLRLDNVVSDVTGETGLAIIKAVLKGERDPRKLAGLRNWRCHKSEAEIAESLIGNYRTEHLFALRQAVELYELYRAKIVECEQEIERYLKELPTVTDDEPPAGGAKRSTLSFDVRTYLYQQLGVDLLRIGGINAETALVIYSEVGRDLSRFSTAKHFASWLSLCPGTKISGGRVLSRQTQRNRNRAAAAFRRAAVSVGRSESALGAFYRRLKSRIGAAAAATATAHKLARLYWTLLQFGQEYVDAGAQAYEDRYRARVVTSLRKRAKTLGYDLAPLAVVA